MPTSGMGLYIGVTGSPLPLRYLVFMAVKLILSGNHGVEIDGTPVRKGHDDGYGFARVCCLRTDST